MMILELIMAKLKEIKMFILKAQFHLSSVVDSIGIHFLI